MAKGFYIGAKNKARNPLKQYIGVNKKAKKVIAMYVGDSNRIARKIYPIDFDGLCLTAREDSTVSYTIVGNLHHDIHIQYCKLRTTWKDWNGETINLKKGEFIYVRNLENLLSYSSQNYFQFIMSGKIVASGDIRSMINFSTYSTYCFAGMFYKCSSLIGAPRLSDTETANGCYYNMFNECSSLKVRTTSGTKIFTALPPTAGEYSNMFKNISGGTITIQSGRTYYWYE